MTVQDLKLILVGRQGWPRPGTRPDVVPNSRGRGPAHAADLTWWDVMSDLDPDWLAWSERLYRGWAPHRWAA